MFYTKGKLRHLTRGPLVAIVGSRSASPAGRRRARRLSRLLVRRGAVVVSGLALGIDGEAHTAAIEAGGRTIAVLGTPLDKCSPARHRALQAVLGRDHLLVSEFRPGSRIERSNFMRRNGTMARLAHAVVVVEGADDSGSSAMAFWALRLGRPVYLLRSLVQRDLNWTRRALDQGALPLRSIDDLTQV